MKTFEIRTQVDTLSYMFSTDGKVTTFIHVYPYIHDDATDEDIVRFPVSSLAKESDFNLGEDDVIALQFSEEHPPLLKLIHQSQGTPHNDVRLRYCPKCGKPLFEDSHGDRYCLNKCCRAQLTPNLLLLTSALGLNFSGGHREVFESILSRRLIVDPADLFELPLERIYCTTIPKLRVHLFQQYLHSVRNNTTLSSLLKGLNIFGMTDEHCNLLNEICISEKISMKDVSKLFDTELLSKYKAETKLHPWMCFISLDTNKQLFLRLCKVLFS